MWHMNTKLAAIGAALVLILASGAAYGAYAMSGGSDPAPSSEPASATVRQYNALRAACGGATPETSCPATATAEPELTCEEADACASPTGEPELTCEQAHACATPETECVGDVCFTPPVPGCPPNAECAPASGFYFCERTAGGVRCTQPAPMPVPPCPMPSPTEDGQSRSIAPACPAPCEGAIPMPQGGTGPRLMPACPPPCLDTPAPNQPEATTPACPAPCPAPPTEPGGGIEPQTSTAACPGPCVMPAPAGPDAGPGAAPGCPEPLLPDCAVSSDGAVTCPGATPGGSGVATAVAATAVPGIIQPEPPGDAPD